MEAPAPDAASRWRVAALVLLGLSGAAVVGAALVAAARGPILAAFLWTAALVLLVPGLALLLPAHAARQRGVPPLAGLAATMLAGSWAGAFLWALAAPGLRLPWPPTMLGTVLNLAMLVASPLAAWHDPPEGWLYLAAGAAAGLGARWAARHRRAR